jgi:hypothetical protein
MVRHGTSWRRQIKPDTAEKVPVMLHRLKQIRSGEGMASPLVDCVTLSPVTYKFSSKSVPLVLSAEEAQN